MTRRMLERLLWSMAAAGAVVTTIVVYRVMSGDVTSSSGIPRIAVDVPARAASHQDSLSRIVAGANPFRLDRAASPLPRESPETTIVPPASPARGLDITLRGTFGARHWEALVEGLPGARSAVIARAGDRFGPMTITRVWKDSIALATGDSTWTLGISMTWK